MAADFNKATATAKLSWAQLDTLTSALEALEIQKPAATPAAKAHRHALAIVIRNAKSRALENAYKVKS